MKTWHFCVIGLALVFGGCDCKISPHDKAPSYEITNSRTLLPKVRRESIHHTGRPSASELATDYAAQGKMDTGRALAWNTAVGYAFANDRNRAIHMADVYRHLSVIEEGAFFDQRRQIWIAVVLYGPGPGPGPGPAHSWYRPGRGYLPKPRY